MWSILRIDKHIYIGNVLIEWLATKGGQLSICLQLNDFIEPLSTLYNDNFSVRSQYLSRATVIISLFKSS